MLSLPELLARTLSFGAPARCCSQCSAHRDVILAKWSTWRPQVYKENSAFRHKAQGRGWSGRSKAGQSAMSTAGAAIQPALSQATDKRARTGKDCPHRGASETPHCRCQLRPFWCVRNAARNHRRAGIQHTTYGRPFAVNI